MKKKLLGPFLMTRIFDEASNLLPTEMLFWSYSALEWQARSYLSHLENSAWKSCSKC